jgi:hypothetical protein
MDFTELVLAQNRAIVKEARASLEAPSAIPDEVRKEMIIKSATDEVAREALAAARVPRVRLNVLAQNMAMDFFEYVRLDDNEVPQYITESDMPVGVSYLSEYGGAPSMIWTGTQNIASMSMYMITSDKVYVPRFSIQQGIIREQDRANARAAYHLSRRVDKDLLALMTANLGEFGADTWILDEDINDMPTTNDLNWSNTLEGKLKKDFFMLLFDHFDRLGKTIKNIYVPVTLPKTIWSWLSVVSSVDSPAEDTVDPLTQREIIQTGTVQQIFGRRFNIIPRKELGSAAGSTYVWVSTTEPAGYFYEKPDFAGTELLNDRRPHMDGFQSYMTIGQAIPAPMKTNFARIKVG